MCFLVRPLQVTGNGSCTGFDEILIFGPGEGLGSMIRNQGLAEMLLGDPPVEVDLRTKRHGVKRPTKQKHWPTAKVCAGKRAEGPTSSHTRVVFGCLQGLKFWPLMVHIFLLHLLVQFCPQFSASKPQALSWIFWGSEGPAADRGASTLKFPSKTHEPVAVNPKHNAKHLEISDGRHENRRHETHCVFWLLLTCLSLLRPRRKRGTPSSKKMDASFNVRTPGIAGVIQLCPTMSLSFWAWNSTAHSDDYRTVANTEPGEAKVKDQCSLQNKQIELIESGLFCRAKRSKWLALHLAVGLGVPVMAKTVPLETESTACWKQTHAGKKCLTKVEIQGIPIWQTFW